MTYILPTTLGSTNASQLRLHLISMIDQSQPLELDGSGVERVGQACLQVLVSASKFAQKIDARFEIKHPSEALRNMTKLAMLCDDLRLTASE